ncbi:hypothetical protein ERO13_A10G181300v2 [Gossypium hirsutum]|uniref:Uncharacterized protein n=3 Tax=Gossypium TaxID=3633 RepID=A0A5J5U916_GOSBA|nr:hypothetical protein ES319_A10G195200v1 [Gossypium barbadense]KAG4180708.1 hypothetical protein ERO13_A10G181300v2 [Gossypium hirsutum]TYG99724.1 hypothetical protein ES288_A10G218500v1 [Gossypium darwinii]TYI07267.1 hypothetical protein ES332_A10G216400v1 [Gossypium tomentosum]
MDVDTRRFPFYPHLEPKPWIADSNLKVLSPPPIATKETGTPTTCLQRCVRRGEKTTHA